MHDGRFMAVVDPETVTEEEIGLLMAGEYPDEFDAEGEPRAGRAAADGGER
jgi:simple sugar transport system ATP-binding protein